MTALLEAGGPCAGHGRVNVLQEVGLTLRERQIVSVIGPNGAGKTTLLAAIMGVLPSRGRVRFAGRGLAGVPERRAQQAGTLSDGERQMLAIGRALTNRPRLLLLDEPSLGLAPLIIREIFRIVTELRQTGVSILVVEQNARATLQLSDYGYVPEMGAVVLEGLSAVLADDPRIAARYLGLGAAGAPVGVVQRVPQRP